MIVLNASGTEIDFDVAIRYMDFELMKNLHAELAPCTSQEFFSAYEHAHAEKFGEEWFLSAANPCW